VCSNPRKPNGTSCNDGDACTRTDRCRAGTCLGSNLVVCSASDTCHTAGICDPADGTCSNPPKPDGTSCSDGDGCTNGDTCQGGTCTGGSTAVCPVGTVEADATVKQSASQGNFGAEPDLETKSGSGVASQILLKVRATGRAGLPVTSASIRLTVKNPTSLSGGRIHPVSCSWNEGDVTWANRPNLGAVLDSEGPVLQDQVVEFDVTTAITGDGVFCFGIDNLGGNVLYHSREAASSRPEFRITAGCACNPP
jgi:hypothetical protein